MKTRYAVTIFPLVLLASSFAGAIQGITTTPQTQPSAQAPTTDQPQPLSTPQTQTAQPNQQTQTTTPIEPMDQTPVFRVNVVGRTTKAVNYHFRSGATRVDLKGTELMPKAHGTARVESHP